MVRANVTGVNTRDFAFMPQAAMPLKLGYETHGGEDIAAYAIGKPSNKVRSSKDEWLCLFCGRIRSS